VEHDRAFAGDDVSQVIVHCVIETRDFDHIAHVQQRLEKEGFRVAPGEVAPISDLEK
jgi:hypothetical protein